MERSGKCCFCGKSYDNWGNDIRPLVTGKGDRCCNECNINIVIPNRIKFWNVEYIYIVEDTRTNKYVGTETCIRTNKISEAQRFDTDSDCIEFITRVGNPDWKLRRIILKEDN